MLTSSVATVGPPRKGSAHSDELCPVEPRSLECVYHAVKHAIEEEALAAGQRGLDVVVLLPSAIFGELDVKAGTGFLVVAVGNRMLPFYVDGLANVVDADDSREPISWLPSAARPVSATSSAATTWE